MLLLASILFATHCFHCRYASAKMPSRALHKRYLRRARHGAMRAAMIWRHAYDMLRDTHDMLL